MVTVKLDVVVKVKEREEERRLEALAAARRHVAQAREALEAAQERARAELCASGRAADFCLYEAARARAQEAVKAATAALTRARQGEEAARQAWVAARSQADAVRRAAETRRREVLQLAESRERKREDELTLLRLAHAG
jgi:flagellar biosynthesis chaperone FliJ